MHENGTRSAFEMPRPLVREMVADWMGAGRAITGHWDIKEWYSKNEQGMLLHPMTKLYVEHILSALGYL